MNWEQWIAENRKQIEHVVGYEENFVRSILAKIPEINPEDVSYADRGGKYMKQTGITVPRM